MEEKPKFVCTQCFGIMTNYQMGIALEHSAANSENVRCSSCGTTHPNFLSYVKVKAEEKILCNLPDVAEATWENILAPCRALLEME